MAAELSEEGSNELLWLWWAVTADNADDRELVKHHEEPSLVGWRLEAWRRIQGGSRQHAATKPD